MSRQRGLYVLGGYPVGGSSTTDDHALESRSMSSTASETDLDTFITRSVLLGEDPEDSSLYGFGDTGSDAASLRTTGMGLWGGNLQGNWLTRMVELGVVRKQSWVVRKRIAHSNRDDCVCAMRLRTYAALGNQARIGPDCSARRRRPIGTRFRRTVNTSLVCTIGSRPHSTPLPPFWQPP